MNIPDNLIELKRLITIATGVAPMRKSSIRKLTAKDLEMLKELMTGISKLADGVYKEAVVELEYVNKLELGDVESEVLTSLVNLGCQRSKALAAVKKARADAALDAQLSKQPVKMDFESLFRSAVRLTA